MYKIGAQHKLLPRQTNDSKASRLVQLYILSFSFMISITVQLMPKKKALGDP